MDLILTALLSSVIGGGAGYAFARWRSVPAVPVVAAPVAPAIVAPPPREVFCQIRVIGDQVYHSHCPNRPRFDAFTLPNPGGEMKDTGHWVRA